MPEPRTDESRSLAGDALEPPDGRAAADRHDPRRYRHFAVTWSIPQNYGGLTSAMLHRSRAFTQHFDVDVDVLTFDARADYPELERRLREEGELNDRLRLRNLWDWLRENPIAPQFRDSRGQISNPFTPLAEHEGEHSEFRDGVPLNRTRYADDGVTVLQVDHLRSDGTVVVSDRRDCRQRGVPGGRSIVVCDESGRPVRSWKRVWSLYSHWLDQLTAGEPSHVIVDAKSLANFALTYRRPHVVRTHVVHSSHLVGRVRPMGTLRPTRAHAFRNLGEFDAVAVLTPTQRDDVEKLLGPQPTLCVIPNSRDLDALESAPLDRPGRDGVMLASLTARKRVNRAIEAFVAARARLADEPGGAGGMQLEIFGEGEERPALEQLIRDLGAEAFVHLRGHRADARDRFARASFTLLTSTSEGQPLVLIEAMAEGCIPVSYDMPYGPADLIRSGENGFLVPNGRVRALADAIVELQRVSAERVLELRAAARATAHEFSDEAVCRIWDRELRAAAARHEHLAPVSLRRTLRRIRNGAFIRR